MKTKIAKEIHCIFLESCCLYGSPKVTALLCQARRRISQKTVAKIMKEQGLQLRNVKNIKLLQIFKIFIRYITMC
ncbi:IS3 family transposase [Bacillus thuringiensis]|uniref:IS3 family transposase n=1 Tax=Bacillus thuringiensis TaxID=1428 RepID=UPI00115F037C|nr:IS3 family transposase [Bacillus thuringiensis]MDZ3952418.1 IS3 family transposase [Bacillus thuringiensis]